MTQEPSDKKIDYINEIDEMIEIEKQTGENAQFSESYINQLERRKKIYNKGYQKAIDEVMELINNYNWKFRGRTPNEAEGFVFEKDIAEYFIKLDKELSKLNHSQQDARVRKDCGVISQGALQKVDGNIPSSSHEDTLSFNPSPADTSSSKKGREEMTQELTKKAQEMIKELNKSQKDWDNFSEGNYPIIQTRISQAKEDWTNELGFLQSKEFVNMILCGDYDASHKTPELIQNRISDLQNALKILEDK